MKVVAHTYIQITTNTERVNKIWAFLKTLFTRILWACQLEISGDAWMGLLYELIVINFNVCLLDFFWWSCHRIWNNLRYWTLNFKDIFRFLKISKDFFRGLAGLPKNIDYKLYFSQVRLSINRFKRFWKILKDIFSDFKRFENIIFNLVFFKNRVLDQDHETMKV